MKRFFAGALALCLATLPLAACGDENAETLPPAETDEIFLTIESQKISVKLETNAATAALIDILEEEDITYTAHGYGGFEMVGDLGHSLPRSDTQMTTGAGDVILYSGDQIVLFYGSNSWSYTKLGRMQGLSAAEVKERLTKSDPVTVKISLQ